MRGKAYKVPPAQRPTRSGVPRFVVAVRRGTCAVRAGGAWGRGGQPTRVYTMGPLYTQCGKDRPGSRAGGTAARGGLRPAGGVRGVPVEARPK